MSKEIPQIPQKVGKTYTAADVANMFNLTHNGDGTFTRIPTAETPKIEQPEFNPYPYMNRLQDLYCEKGFQAELLADTANRLKSVLAEDALKSTQAGTENDFHLPAEPSTHFESLAESLFESLGNVCYEGPEPFVAVPVTVARYALAAMIEAHALKEVAIYQPLKWFGQGDFSAIDLKTDAGRGYLAVHFFDAMGSRTSMKEFDDFVDYCRVNREILFLTDTDEVQE